MRSGAALLGSIFLLPALLVGAEARNLSLSVKDLQGHVLSGIRLAVYGGSEAAAKDGKLDIPLIPGRGATWVRLHFVDCQNFVLISPWDGQIRVPGAESSGPIPVILAIRGSKELLQDPLALLAMVKRIDRETAPLEFGVQPTGMESRVALLLFAKLFGVAPEELDRAIRSWGQKTPDPLDRGLVDLADCRYPAATREIATSLMLIRSRTPNEEGELVDINLVLGQSLFGEGKYAEAANAFGEANRYREGDVRILTPLGVSLLSAGQYSLAEPVLRGVLTILEKSLSPENPGVAVGLSNLAHLLQAEKNYAGAEPLYRRALAIREKALGDGHPEVANTLSSLALVLTAKKDSEGAEALYRRALSIRERTFGPTHPEVARSLNNLASLLSERADYAASEPLYRRALAIQEKALGPDHPDVARTLNDLAALLTSKKDYAAAEPLFRRALTIREKALGPDHPDVARSLNNLALLLKDMKNYADAEPLYRRALVVCEKSLGPDHPDVAMALNNLAMLLKAKGDSAAAEPLLRRALAIDEKALGPEHATTRRIRNNLNTLGAPWAKDLRPVSVGVSSRSEE
jgi:tetratricopeptide (TPR) repeat protein